MPYVPKRARRAIALPTWISAGLLLLGGLAHAAAPQSQTVHTDKVQVAESASPASDARPTQSGAVQDVANALETRLHGMMPATASQGR